MAADKSAAAGLAAGAAAFSLWGVYPFYFKAAAAAPAPEILAHRVVWSVLFVALAITAARRWPAARAVMRDRRTLVRLGISAFWVSVNWGVFIWAVTHGETLQSSLGYYITPLLSVALGVGLLGERLGRTQWFCVALAAAGVIWLTLTLGKIPWIALTLGFTFGFYGLMRKRIGVDGMTGLFIETALLAPLGIAYLVWLNVSVSGEPVFLHHSRTLDMLILAAGLVTAVPLMLFAEAARRLPLSTVGFLQYITPTGHLLVAVFAFGENFTVNHAVTFVCIWTALAVYSADSLRLARLAHLARRRAAGY